MKRSHPHTKVCCTWGRTPEADIWALWAYCTESHPPSENWEILVWAPHWNPEHELLSFCHSLTTGFVYLHFIHILPNGTNKGWREMVSSSEHNYIWVWILVLSFSVILRSFLGFLPYGYPYEGWSALNYCTQTAWMLWEMAQWLNHLPYKGEDQSSDAQSPRKCKCQVGMAAHLWFQSSTERYGIK